MKTTTLKPFLAGAAAGCFCLSAPIPPAQAEHQIDPDLRIEIARTNESVVLSWFGSNAVLYQVEVEASTDFTWTNLSPVLTGTGFPLAFTNAILSTSRALYRVKRFPPITAVFDPATGILTVTGNDADNTISISRDGSGLMLVNYGAVPVTGGVAAVANTLLVEVFGRAGNDQLTMDQSGGALPAAHLFGEAGADTLTGSSAADQLFGGPGADTLLGRGENDLLNGGPDDDTMVWYPGDGSDVLEGQGGTTCSSSTAPMPARSWNWSPTVRGCA